MTVEGGHLCRPKREANSWVGTRGSLESDGDQAETDEHERRVGVVRLLEFACPGTARLGEGALTADRDGTHELRRRIGTLLDLSLIGSCAVRAALGTGCGRHSGGWLPWGGPGS